jgi:AcrR family transcriptional regulator
MDAPEPSERQRILQAALEEVIAKGIDGLSEQGIAARAGIDPRIIFQTWGDWRALFMEAALTDARKRFPPPDTGSLRGDLVAYATRLAKVPERGWFRRMLATNQDVDFSEIRDDYWTVRAHDFAPIFQRGKKRGEVRDDIVPIEACRMFTTACLYDVIFTGKPVRDEYAAALIDIFIRGIAPGD